MLAVSVLRLMKLSARLSETGADELTVSGPAE
jgi:hypothetical protein